MNNILLSSLVGNLLGLASAGLLAEQADIDVIKSVIQSETEAFYKRDADAWQDTWSHQADVTRTLVSSSRYFSVVGWEKFGPQIIQGLQQAAAVPVKFKNSNFTAHVGPRMAWVEYDQSMTLAGVEGERLSREHRALTKIDGKWKIVTQITHDLPWPAN